jgi:hypothetical protein
MSRSFSLEQLSEGIKQRHLGTVNKRLVEKWNRTGLLRGLEGQRRENMASLLENQTAQILREDNSLGAGAGGVSASGDIRGFTNIAFPIVRRVFGGLVANELVSIQPMSLPSGLLFYLDYSYGTNRGGNNGVDGVGGQAATYVTGASIYGSPLGKSIQAGASTVGGQYDLAGSGFSRVHVSSSADITVVRTGSYNGGAWTNTQPLTLTGTDARLIGFDPVLTNRIDAGESYHFLVVSSSQWSNADITMVKDVALFKASGAPTNLGVVSSAVQGGVGLLNVRRLNQLGNWDDSTKAFTPRPLDGTHLLMVVSGATVGTAIESGLRLSWIQSSQLDVEAGVGSTLTIPSFESNFAVDPSPAIPEIDIKIESLAVTAQTRKLRARWSPELAQDLNAYHSMDAEVELTQILSEQIALELDREILNDLLTQAAGANYYWSRAPGKFVNKTNGSEIARNSSIQPGPAFTGTVREWYETLVETVIDVANEIHRKTLRGSANFIVVSPDVATILEASVLYKPVYSIDGSGQVGSPMSIGAEKIGSLSNRFTVYKDPYFPRNKVLVGFKGGSYLETGYVYAPYVPLIVTPTIFAPEDFTPRKGVMTRYGKKMVRADFYGTVTILDLNII